jgi:hypothetical protein
MISEVAGATVLDGDGLAPGFVGASEMSVAESISASRAARQPGGPDIVEACDCPSRKCACYWFDLYRGCW